LRGGSSGNVDPVLFRCAYRLCDRPEDHRYDGFRVARTLTP